MILQPVKISKTPKNEVRFDWNDGSFFVFNLKTLRASCPCALCVDEHTGERILDPNTIPEDISIINLRSIGRYAVGITWTDGHRSGIYPYRQLKELTKTK